MAGNVSEWVMDVYRPLTSEDFDGLNPFRGNVFKAKVQNSEGELADKLEDAIYDVPGIKEYIVDFTAERKLRRGGVLTDSLDFVLLAELDSLVSLANNLYNDGRQIDASIAIGEVIETNLPEISDRVQQAPGLENFQFEIIPKLITGISDFVVNTPGNMKMRNVTKEENLGRRNYNQADYKSYLDGDLTSSLYYNNEDEIEKVNEFNSQSGAKRNRSGSNPDFLVYQSGKKGSKEPSTLVTDKSRVYKGGSWKDRAFCMSPGNRRFYDEFRSTDDIGFRCAMTRVGSPTGKNSKSARNR
jgi:hypothetical protein